MNTIRPCGCKGVRTCLQCERDYDIAKPALQDELMKLEAWTFCVACGLVYPGWSVETVCKQHPVHNGQQGVTFPGVVVQEHFISVAEGATLMQGLDSLPWAISQSGRRKQNFGPKTNFKKKKLQNGTFTGFPKFSEFVQNRFAEVPQLREFQTIEQCSLEYEPEKGASIDPHIDDCWIWGERVVTVNCLGDAVLTLTYYDEEAAPASKYNLDLVPQYADKLLIPLAEEEELAKWKKRVIRIPMPNLSLIVLYGPARYQFEHAVLREDVRERRVCLAYREFTPMYIDGESREKGEPVIQNAQIFWTGTPYENQDLKDLRQL